MRPFLTFIVVLWQAAVIASEPVDYVRDIKPVLKERCLACHGALKQEANLRLDTAALMYQGGDSGAAILSGSASSSPLIERISADDESERMPPEGKPLTAEEIQLLRLWINQGAKAPADEEPEQDPTLHWAFQKPIRPAVPIVDSSADVENEIDAFISQHHRQVGMTALPNAEKHVLLRRVYLDLIGLPPTREQLHAFRVDDSPEAYANVVDELLSSPQYGERWGRHWMDVWRYADWHGRRHVPDVWNSAPQVWRWRDWIVKSLNRDHGYDRMIQEMLAADEIVPEDTEAGYATGYLIRNWYALNPNDWMRNNVEHVGKAFLGLTFNCAHCHDHKYDPISHDDYFRMRAFFEPISIRQDRVAGEPDPGPFQKYEYGKLRKIQQTGAVRIFDENLDAVTWFYTGGDERNRDEERGSITPGVPEFLSFNIPLIEAIDLPLPAWYPGARPEIRETVLADAEAAVQAAEKAATAVQQVLNAPTLPQRAADAEQAAALAERASVRARIVADKARYGETPDADSATLILQASQAEREAGLLRAEADLLAQDLALFTAENKPTDAKGRDKEIAAARKAIEAGKTQLAKAKSVMTDEPDTYTGFGPTYPKSSTGRRKALTEWMTDRDNPLTARVAVNHIWMRHFHVPIVASVNDFGRNGDLPSHPKLLDWLAVELMETGWSMKHIHRLIVSSAAYQRTSAASGAESWVNHDPENKLLWRMNAGRMEAEIIRDSLLFCGAKLDLTMGGQSIENTESLKTDRRSVYYSVYPEQGGQSPLGELFDGPNPLDCYRRTRTVIPQQALAMTNSELVHRMSAALVETWGTADEATEQFIVTAFEQVLTRIPTAAERQTCVEAFEAQIRTLQHAGKDEKTARQEARESLVRAFFNHNDFVTIR